MRTLDEMVQQEVIYCVSHLVSELSHTNGHYDEFLEILVRDDWEEPAKEYIWNDMPAADKKQYLEERGFAINSKDTDKTIDDAIIQDLKDEDCFQVFCESNNVEPHTLEALEHWIVSDWLADRLQERGEMVHKDLYGLTVWGRTTSGQSITMDGVIQDIYNERCAR